MNKNIYFAGKFETISIKFANYLQKLKENNENKVIFLFYESDIISFEDRKRLLEEHLQGLNFEIKRINGNKLINKSENEGCSGVHYRKEKSKFSKLKAVDVPLNYVYYILNNHLYIYDKIYNLMSEERYKHTVSVALTAIEIAKSNEINPNKAFIASMLHDIAKDTNTSVLNEIMQKKCIKYIDEDKVVYHQFVGEIFARKLFKIYNKDILNSIKFHTTGRTNMTLCSKIVYSADKIEPTRGYDSKYMIDACKNDINSGFELVLSENMKFLRSKNIKIAGLTYDAANFYNIEL